MSFDIIFNIIRIFSVYYLLFLYLFYDFSFYISVLILIYFNIFMDGGLGFIIIGFLSVDRQILLYSVCINLWFIFYSFILFLVSVDFSMFLFYGNFIDYFFFICYYFLKVFYISGSTIGFVYICLI